MAATIGQLDPRSAQIATVEDPIEVIYPSHSIIQREIGTHVESFPEAIRDCVRQSRTTIVVSESGTRKRRMLRFWLHPLGIVFLPPSTLTVPSIYTPGCSRWLTSATSACSLEICVGSWTCGSGVAAPCAALGAEKKGGHVKAEASFIATLRALSLVRGLTQQQVMLATALTRLRLRSSA